MCCGFNGVLAACTMASSAVAAQRGTTDNDGVEQRYEELIQ